ncbi:MAG: helix-turn-helix transcriptional regulator [Dechloromonas sp.]|uniref:helix-turn-helix domain-containing protein n=1 Tax=Dechloromonas sp. TaxID=1917218 RepID=UPI0027FE3C3C|nr:helix-turn-helix transcriptional regulator [Dechloromonas sp.]MBT9521908.1 helix-turn-helix transcriptional regulator [Dechloromonas sp.]
MIVNKELSDFLDTAKAKDTYWVEKAKIDYAMALEKQRKAAGFSYSDIAKKIASSAAYISKVFRGDSNLTIESMVKLSRAAGGRLDVRIIDEKAQVITPAFANWNNGAKFVVIPTQRKTTVTSSSISFANEEICDGLAQKQAA